MPEDNKYELTPNFLKNKVKGGGEEIIILTSGYEEHPLWKNTEDKEAIGESPGYDADFKQELERLTKLKEGQEKLRERIDNQPVTQLDKVYNVHKGKAGKLPRKLKKGWS